MNEKTLSQGEPWMTSEERALNHDFIHNTSALLASRGVPQTPLVMLRVNDVIATWLLARRLELALTPEPGEPAPCPTPAQAGAIGKCRDRLRRAMKELEACCPRNTDTDGRGLVDHMFQPAPPLSEASPPKEDPNPNEAQTTKNEEPESPHNPRPTINDTTVQATTTQPNTESTGPSSTPPCTTPPQPPPPVTQPTRQRKSPKKRRKKRGIPIRSSPS